MPQCHVSCHNAAAILAGWGDRPSATFGAIKLCEMPALPFCVALRQNLVVRSAICKLLPNTAIPIHCHDSADPPQKFWFERRYWEHSIFSPSQVRAFRKLENNRNVNTLLQREFGLGGHEWLAGGTRGEPMLCSTRFLLTWSTQRWFMAIAKGPNSRAPQWKRIVADMFVAAASGCAKLSPAERPSISVGQFRLAIDAEARLDLSPLVNGPWPSLPGEWDSIAGLRDAAISPMPADRCVSLEELHWFAACRVKWADPVLPQGHLIRDLRGVVIDVSCFLIEIHVHFALADAAKRKEALTPVQLVGPGGCRVKVCVYSRYTALRKCIAGHGSDAVTTTALGCRQGQACVMRAVRNKLYLELSRSELHKQWSVAVNWDGSSHGGLDALVGTVLCTSTSRAYYLRPMACFFCFNT